MNDFKRWYFQQPPALRTIITVNVVVWVIMQILHVWEPGLDFLNSHFALHPVFPDILLEPWQLVTYSFMHAGLLHIGINMLLLFWVGREFERMHGSEQFWTAYIATAIGGAILCLVLSPFVPRIAGGEIMRRGVINVVPVLGASASVLGVLTIVAVLYPYKQIRLLFFGIVPLMWVVVGFIAIDTLLAFSSTGRAVAAHWGGALTGFLYARSQQGRLGVFSSVGSLFGGGSSRGSSPGLLSRIKGWFQTPSSTDTSPTQRPGGSDGAPSQSSDRTEEVDRILDKISENGYESLSDEEKRILHEASES